jgi:hypothetical protein
LDSWIFLFVPLLPKPWQKLMVHDDGTVVKHGIGRLWTVNDSFRATANSLLFFHQWCANGGFPAFHESHEIDGPLCLTLKSNHYGWKEKTGRGEAARDPSENSF